MSARRGSTSVERARRSGAGVPAARHQPQGQLRLPDIQRSRLLAAAAQTIEELGYASTTVAHIITRARISRRTFYDLFENREDCLLAVIEDTLAQLTGELQATSIGDLAWVERLHEGIWRTLCFFDRQPAVARVLVVQALQGGPRVLERREQILQQLAAIVDVGRQESSRAADAPVLTAEGLVGAALAILHARLIRPDHEPLVGLSRELMGMIVLPYLGPAAARRERARPVPAAVDHASPGLSSGRDSLAGIPLRLTYRTARVLVEVGESPGASNRGIADHVGISDQGQVSRLLARLERLGLLVNTGVGRAKGEPNAWGLTPAGERVTDGIRNNGRDPRASV
jgi:AcrR family transcriptional regulator